MGLPIHVMAAVIRDPAGRVLLARRTRGRDLAGLWEFPGGKREPGESEQQALARELEEELGIQLQSSHPLIRVPFDYPGKRILLDVHQVLAYGGRPQGRERQALAWAPLDTLSQYPMPPADRPVVAALTRPDRLAITPEPGADHDLFCARALQLAKSGLRVLQLRWHAAAPGQLEPLARRLLPELRALGCELLVNGDIDVARRLGCGLHLRAAQLGAVQDRPLPAQQLLMASCHSPAELQRAEQIGADAAVLGPVRETLTHPGLPGLGWDRFAEWRAATALPIYALGGLGADDMAAARAHGAQGVAAIRAFWPG